MCVYLAIVKLVVQVKLLPSPEQASVLEATLRACNEAATWASSMAFETNVKSNFALREHTYRQIKVRCGLGAQAAQHVIKKTCDTYAALKANLKAGNLGRPGSQRYRRAMDKPVAFRPQGAQPYDDRMLSWQIDQRRISIWTTAGRMKGVAYTAAPEQSATLALYREGESDLLQRDGMWFLHATCDVPEVPSNTDPVDFLGIDLGIVNIATTSDGEIMAGRQLNRTRSRDRELRTKLQRRPSGRGCRWCTSIRRTPRAPAPSAATSTGRTGYPKRGSHAGTAGSLITQTGMAPATSGPAPGSCGDAGPSQRPLPHYRANGTGLDASSAPQPVMLVVQARRRSDG
ncbi:hypothetical protein GCM10010278_51900 [Streptomyces melanogenes]|nr:hypothetical protein GCM10010278_51900 [Streptomyces melanogenes]